MTKLNITINSRVYTVVADEEIEYLERLCNYVNDKVKLVINEGNHVMGEKPVVLAALNICDEYFKLLDASAPQEKFSEVISKNRQLEEEIRDLKKDSERAEEKLNEYKENAELAEGMLGEAEEKVKFLEGQISALEGKIKKQRGEFAIRERELLDMLESK